MSDTDLALNGEDDADDDTAQATTRTPLSSLRASSHTTVFRDLREADQKTKTAKTGNSCVHWSRPSRGCHVSGKEVDGVAEFGIGRGASDVEDPPHTDTRTPCGGEGGDMPRPTRPRRAGRGCRAPRAILFGHLPLLLQESRRVPQPRRSRQRHPQVPCRVTDGESSTDVWSWPQDVLRCGVLPGVASSRIRNGDSVRRAARHRLPDALRLGAAADDSEAPRTETRDLRQDCLAQNAVCLRRTMGAKRVRKLPETHRGSGGWRRTARTRP